VQYKEADETLANIDAAVKGNGSARSAAIIGMVKLHQPNDRISDDDFKQASQGAKDIWTKSEQELTELLVPGMSVDKARAMREVVNIAKQAKGRRFMAAQDAMLSLVSSPNNKLSPAERDMYIQSASQDTPKEYWDPIIVKAMGYGGESNPANKPKAATPQARASAPNRPLVSPNGVPLVAGSRVPPKPPRKTAADMTDAELEGQSEEKLMQMLQEAASAP
jgi:hypothetical protein